MRIELACAAVLTSALVIGAAPAAGQTGNASDVTGPLTTGSDIAAVGAPAPPAGFNPVVLASVGAAAVDIAAQLGSVQVQADGSVTQTLSESNVLSVGIGVDPPAVLAQALGGGALAMELASAMDGLLLNATPEQVTAAVDAFNDLVMGADAAYLSNPPAELTVVKSVLDGLITAAREGA